MVAHVGKLRTNRGRTIRDCIHGDVELTSLECAIVDTRPFQRLRYIRQNGLLHFVFPGAVHTRFAHSIGTLHVARHVERQLFEPLWQIAKNKEQRAALEYLGTVFRASALLHDIGHCAFSHSIEHVEVRGEPLLGRLGTFCKIWGAEQLLEQLVAAYPDEPAVATSNDSDEDGNPDQREIALGEGGGVPQFEKPPRPGSPVEHEHISLVLVGSVFGEKSVQAECGGLAAELTMDIRAVIDGKLPRSNQWSERVDQVRPLVESLHGDCTRNLERNLINILHRLVSGTLDVDRLDYLIRDSMYCGVPYGRCDTNILIGSLQLGEVAGELELLLHRKAAHALADMLWSRYQLFVQVYNHKTNCGFNAALGKALSQALEDKQIHAPDTRKSLLYFTDDYVMGSLARACAGSSGDSSTYDRLLIHRRPPRHLGEEILRSGEDPAAAAKALADKLDVDLREDAILPYTAKSRFVKPDGLPTLVHNDRATGKRMLTNFDDVSTITSDKNLRATDYAVVHLFRESSTTE